MDSITADEDEALRKVKKEYHEERSDRMHGRVTQMNRTMESFELKRTTIDAYYECKMYENRRTANDEIEKSKESLQIRGIKILTGIAKEEDPDEKWGGVEFDDSIRDDSQTRLREKVLGMLLRVHGFGMKEVKEAEEFMKSMESTMDDEMGILEFPHEAVDNATVEEKQSVRDEWKRNREEKKKEEEQEAKKEVAKSKALIQKVEKKNVTVLSAAAASSGGSSSGGDKSKEVPAKAAPVVGTTTVAAKSSPAQPPPATVRYTVLYSTPRDRMKAHKISKTPTMTFSQSRFNPIVMRKESCGQEGEYEISYWAELRVLRETHPGGVTTIKHLVQERPIDSDVAGHVAKVPKGWSEKKVYDLCRPFGPIVGFWGRKHSDGSLEQSFMVQYKYARSLHDAITRPNAGGIQQAGVFARNEELEATNWVVTMKPCNYEFDMNVLDGKHDDRRGARGDVLARPEILEYEGQNGYWVQPNGGVRGDGVADWGDMQRECRERARQRRY